MGPQMTFSLRANPRMNLFFVMALGVVTGGLPTHPLPVLHPPAQQRIAVLAEGPDSRTVPRALWQWGDELVLLAGPDQTRAAQMRSRDGGATWSRESDFPSSAAAGAPAALDGPIDFSAPDLALVFIPAPDRGDPSLYVSLDRCETWRGPFACSIPGVQPLDMQADLVPLGPADCVIVGTAAKTDGARGRAFCARTTDGGLHWRLVSFVGPDPGDGYAVTPSSIKLKHGSVETSLLRNDPGQPAYLQIWRSEDQGAHWIYYGKPAWAIGEGDEAALVPLADGRYAVTYGYRLKPYGVRAQISDDDGYIWGSQIELSSDGHAPATRHPLSVLRPGGQILTIFGEEGIRAVLWTPTTADAELKIHPTPTSPLTDDAIWKNGAPVAFPDAEVTRPKVESVFVYRPTTEWTYSHHQSITFFKGRFYALWSNGHKNEDDPGQRIVISSSADFYHWTDPQPLVNSVIENGVERVLTAGGLHDYNATLVAYFGNYGPNKETTRLEAVTTTDGIHWSPVREMGIPVCPNHGPEATRTGRLIISGMLSYPYTDDPSGLTGWHMTGIYPSEMDAFYKDDPASFREGAARSGWPAAVCESSFFQTDDGTIHMLLRNDARAYAWHLWETESRDDGATWSEPALTQFSNGRSKFHFGRLPDGRFYCVGNQIGNNRMPLVLSVSKDGVRFDRQYILGETHYEKKRDGWAKGGEYSYPHSLLHDGYLYVVVARVKEAEQVIRVRLDDLTR
jgi:hypothetical protein